MLYFMSLTTKRVNELWPQFPIAAGARYKNLAKMIELCRKILSCDYTIKIYYFCRTFFIFWKVHICTWSWGHAVQSHKNIRCVMWCWVWKLYLSFYRIWVDFFLFNELGNLTVYCYIILIIQYFITVFTYYFYCIILIVYYYFITNFVKCPIYEPF